MRKSTVFIILILLQHCSIKHEATTYPNLDIDPVLKAIRKNKVKSYYQVLHGIDYKGKAFSYKSDSLNFSKSGNLESFYQLDDFLGGTRYLNKYDSLNRIIAQDYSSCTGSENLFKYDFDPNKNEIKKYKYEIIRGDTVLMFKTTMSLDKRNRKVQFASRIWKETNDTIDFTYYKYLGDTLLGISSYSKNVDYHYNDAGRLLKISRIRYDNEGKPISDYSLTDYISPESGLIDSTSLDEYGWIKYYYYSYWD